MTDLNNSNYYKKINEYTDSFSSKMFIFEVTKCCGYSAFVLVYKDQLVNELYSNVFNHFGRNQILSLYILDNDGNKLLLSDHLNRSVRDFIEQYTNNDNRLLNPVYPLPLPVVYKIYLDDGHIHESS